MSIRKLLVVDDQQINLDIFDAVLKSYYQIVSVNNAMAALDILREPNNDITLILLDINMPEMSGLDMMEVMNKDKDIPSIPVVIVTASDTLEDEVRAIALGAWDVIKKPFDAVLLRSKIDNIIRKNSELSHAGDGNMWNDEQMHIILDNTIAGVAMCELLPGCKFDVFYCNKYHMDILGVSSDDENEKPFISEYLDISDRRQLYNVLECEHRRGVPLNFEFEIIASDNNITKSIASTWIRIDYNSKKYPVWIVTLRDITVYKEKMRKETEYIDELRYRADYDLVTGLANKDCFIRESTALLKRHVDEDFLMVCIKIEMFDFVTNLLGDNGILAFLIDTADKLTELSNERTSIGRVDTDTFALCITKSLFDERFINIDFSPVYNYKEINCVIDIKAGVYPISDRNMNPSDMLFYTKIALRYAEEDVLVSYRYFNDFMLSETLQEQEINFEMQEAIDKKQFVMYLQPIYDLDANMVVSAEALVRWIHPKKGMISPGKFIPVFERNGFITILDQYIWDSVCSILAQRRNEGLPDIPISVNVSRRSIYSMDICSALLKLTEKYKISPHLLRLEVTESAYIDDPSRLIEIINQLQNYGFTIMMDDFGSGYSSLNMLKQLPVNILKIDMKFIDDIVTSKRASDILSSVIYMAWLLDIPVIAEGVETMAQLKHLYKLGCKRIQGYFYSKPLPREEFEIKIKDTISPEYRISEDDTKSLVVS